MQKDGFIVKEAEYFLAELYLMSTSDENFVMLTKLPDTFPSQSLLEGSSF